MKKVSRLLKMCFVGMFLFVLCSCTTNIPTTPSDAESKLTEKGYDVDVFNEEKDAPFAAAFIFSMLYHDMPDSFDEILADNVTDVIMGKMGSDDEGNLQEICAIWFKTSETAREVFEPFHTHLEENAEDEKLKDYASKRYENIIYIGTEKGIIDFES